MAQTENIEILNLEKNVSDGAVYNINYKLTVTVDGKSASKNLTVWHLVVDPLNFTPFDDLTEAQVKGWFTAPQNEIDALAAEASSKNTDVVTPPWSNT